MGGPQSKYPLPFSTQILLTRRWNDTAI